LASKIIDERAQLITGLGQEFSRGQHIKKYFVYFKTVIDYAKNVDCNALSYIWP
jgi:hypothetical protein